MLVVGDTSARSRRVILVYVATALVATMRRAAAHQKEEPWQKTLGGWGKWLSVGTAAGALIITIRALYPSVAPFTLASVS